MVHMGPLEDNKEHVHHLPTTLYGLMRFLLGLRETCPECRYYLYGGHIQIQNNIYEYLHRIDEERERERERTKDRVVVVEQ